MTSHHRFARLLAASAPMLILLACSDSAAPPLTPVGSENAIAITAVRVITMNPDADILDNRTVLVEEGRIVAIVDASLVDLHPETMIIDGSGRTLLPGLADMHVHVKLDDLPVYVAHGITTVRNCWGWDGLQDHIQRAEAGEIVSPAIYSLSPGVDGNPPSWPQTQLITDPAEAPALVGRLAKEGWIGLKLYQSLRRDVYDAVVAAARNPKAPAFAAAAVSSGVATHPMPGRMIG